MKKIQFSETMFYAIGKYVFFAIAVLGLAGWIDGLKVNDGIQILRGLGMIIFNFGLMGFFSYMLSKFKDQATEEEALSLAEQVAKMEKEGKLEDFIQKKDETSKKLKSS